MIVHVLSAGLFVEAQTPRGGVFLCVFGISKTEGNISRLPIGRNGSLRLCCKRAFCRFPQLVHDHSAGRGRNGIKARG